MTANPSDTASERCSGSASQDRPRLPALNVLVNNAGIMLRENLLDPAGLPAAEAHVATNLLGPIRMTYAFLPLLVGKDDAVVMNVTSALAFVPYPSTPTYSATKTALHSFSESLRIQLAGADVGVQGDRGCPAGRAHDSAGPGGQRPVHAVGRIPHRDPRPAAREARREGDCRRARQVHPRRGGQRYLRQHPRHDQRQLTVPSAELFGQLNNAIEARDEYFDRQMRRLAEVIGVGLTQPDLTASKRDRPGRGRSVLDRLQEEDRNLPLGLLLMVRVIRVRG